MNEMRLSCTSDVVALSASPIAGSDGRYMSIATGPIRDKSPRMIAVLTRLEFIWRSPREADAFGRLPAAAGPEVAVWDFNTVHQYGRMCPDWTLLSKSSSPIIF